METLKKRRVESFEIVLEHDIDEQYQYVPGEMMKGVVVITLNEEIKINQLSVTLQGEGNVIWEQDQKSSKKPSKFKTKEIYLDYTEYLINSTSSSPNTTLEAGKHEFVFYYQLNESLPSSYIGKYGSVTYLIKAQLRPDRKYGADAEITNEPFLVLRTYDLSLEPFKLQPYEERASKTVKSGCLCGGKVRVFVKLNRTGYIPGEDIKLNADVANGSSLEITSLTAALMMTSKFHSGKSFITNDQVISKHEDQYAVDEGEGRRWNDVRLTIPPYIPESALEGCDIIDINYALVFQVVFDFNSNPKNTLRIVIPLTIGTHGITADDNPTEDPDLRPLYHRAPEPQEQRIQSLPQAHDDDEMGEIDTSLFEDAGSKPGYNRKYSKKSEGGGSMRMKAKKEQEKANPVNFLYGDLVAANDLPDDRLEGTIRDNKRPSTKKKKAPEAPVETGNINPEFNEEEEETSKL